jgi:hypothetical protein
MKKESNVFTKGSTQRSFLKNGTVAGAATVGAGLFAGKAFAFDRENDADRAPITKGDIAILRFLQALEQVEEALWRQYAELAGTQDNEFTGLTGGNVAYSQALQLLDGDMPQYKGRWGTADWAPHQSNPNSLSTPAFGRSTAASPIRILIPRQTLLRRFPV